ncbi:MAG: hypothetical protein KDE31_30550, partial [Caldilineaceae bacterium]|nr:hypothetical protein [Caldilineaceae bacterium]
FLGLLLAIVTVWIILNWGWNVMPPPLAPGAEYRAASHQLTLRYEYPSHVAETPAGRDAQPLILAEVGTAQQRAPVGSTIRLQQGQTLITNHAGPPALLIETLSGEPLLSRLGQSQTMPSMGLIFPSPGSEETIVVGQVLGLRVVRLPAQSPDQPEQFLAELYDANSELLERIPIQEQSTAELQIQERTITLAFALLPSMAVEVAHRPGMWLFWPALLLVVLGLIGHRYRPAFVLAQLGNWPEQRSVVIIQSDRADEVTALAQWLNLAAEVE